MFDFEVIYVPGSENILGGALLRTVFMEVVCNAVAAPVFVALEACVNFKGRQYKGAQECEGTETGTGKIPDKFAAHVTELFHLRGTAAPALNERFLIRIPACLSVAQNRQCTEHWNHGDL